MANPKSISHRCHPILVAFVREVTEETINLPLDCLQGGFKAGIWPRAQAHTFKTLHPTRKQETLRPNQIRHTLRDRKLLDKPLSRQPRVEYMDFLVNSRSSATFRR